MRRPTGQARRAAAELFALFWRADPKRTALVMFLAVVAAVNGPLSALWLKLLTEGVVEQRRDLVIVAVLCLSAGSGVAGLAAMAGTLIRIKVAYAATELALARVMDLSFRLPGIEHLERPEYLDRVQLLRHQIPGMIQVGWSLLDFGVTALNVVIASVILASVHPALLVLCVFALPIVWGTATSQRRMILENEALAENERREAYLFQLATTSAAAKELRVFGLEQTVLRRRADVYDALVSSQISTLARALMGQTLGSLVFGAGFVAAVVLVAVRAANGDASPGDVLLAFTAGTQLRQHVGGVAGLGAQAVGALRGLTHYLWFLDYTADKVAHNHDPVEPPSRLTTGISMQRVCFTYPGTDHQVLTDVSVDLQAGSVVALVGENGAGKTTIVKLLTLMYAPSEGSITVDGTRLDNLSADGWRQRVTASFQDFVRFELLAREAVGIGDLRHFAEPTAVEEALARTGGAEMVRRLPQGLETQLGCRFSGGLDLSGGQWQTIALARAVMRTSPLLLVLDEPTSGLDAAAENALFEQHAEAARKLGAHTGAITLLVSHRFSTVQMADVIIVLKGNTVDDVGTHDELMQRNGHYAELFEVQATSYR